MIFSGVLALAAAALCAALSICRAGGESFVPYKEFCGSVEKGEVSSAKIQGDKIFFTKSDGGKFSTQNPRSPVLRERLMREGVDVSEGNSASGTVSAAMDVLFYAIFFALIFFVFKKFISPNTFRVARKTGVTFDDVVGMDSLKRDMMQVVDIMRAPEKYAARGIRMPKGIILEGAPGNGKTLFARALAGEARVNFIAAKATDFESMFMAIGPAKVKLLFRKARKRAPCIVFIDEFDGIGTRRNYSGSALETENTRIVTALLNELDGFTPNSGILALAATNSAGALDEALIRPGRFDARFRVPFPDDSAREKLSSMYSRGKKPAPECSPAALSKMFKGFSCAKIESTLNRAALIASQESREEFTMADVSRAAKEL